VTGTVPAEQADDDQVPEYWRGRYDQLQCEITQERWRTSAHIRELDEQLKRARQVIDDLRKHETPLWNRFQIEIARLLPWRQKTYWNLPREAREACDRFCAKIPGFTREQYVSTYDWDDHQRW
jgi:hypothetical protein